MVLDAKVEGEEEVVVTEFVAVVVPFVMLLESKINISSGVVRSLSWNEIQPSKLR